MRRQNICAKTGDDGSTFLVQRAATIRRGERGCNLTAVKTRQRVPRPVVLSVFWSVMAWSRRAGRFTFGKASKSGAQAIYFWLRTSFPGRSAMYALAAAQFALQRGSFSCRNTHAFNRI